MVWTRQPPSNLNFTDQLTATAWIKPTTPAPGNTQTIIGKWYTTGGDSFLLSIDLNQRARFSVKLENNQQYIVEAPVAFDKWSHVTGVLTNWSSNRQIRLYINGVNVANTQIPVGMNLKATTGSIVIGNHPSWNDYRGYVDNISLYRSALPDSDIKALASQHQMLWRWQNGYGSGSTTRMLSDVTGDGKADAISFYKSTGQWYVSTAANDSFNGSAQWLSSMGIGSDRQFAADVTGDGKGDATVFFKSLGAWYVSKSYGSGFQAYTQWLSSMGIGSDNQFLADVNGDKKADAVVFFKSLGAWYVSLSNGNGFGPYALWTSGHGIGSDNQFLADVTGDGRADAVIFIKSTGAWYVSKSNGNGFDPFTLWIAGHGIGSSRQFLGDVTGSGSAADALVYFGTAGQWYTARSTGSSFSSFVPQVFGVGIGSNDQLLGDVNNDGREDLVTFTNASGTWNTAISY